MLGYETPEVAGMRVRDLVTPESWEVVEQKVASGNEEPYETVVVTKDGAKLDVEVRGKVSTYRGRSVRIAALRDVTKRKRAERGCARPRSGTARW